MKTIKVTVSPKGKTTIRTTGFIGSACKQETADLVKLLGEIEEEKLTSEFYQEDPNPNYINQRR